MAGIARHDRRRGSIEVIGSVAVSLDGGIAGDWRGERKPGGQGRRQVTLMERADWAAAMDQLRLDIPWQERRCNLLVDLLDLPQVAGAVLRIGAAVRLEITVETNPCFRMEALAPGLFAALEPDWRGGVCTRVLAGGDIAVGDEIRIEEP